MTKISHMRRVKKYKLTLETCSIRQTFPLPLYATGYHRGLGRTVGLLIKGLIEKQLLTDSDLIDWLMYHRVIDRNRLLIIVGSFDRETFKEVEK